MAEPDVLDLLDIHSDRVALEDAGRTLTYAELGPSVRTVAAMLQRRGVSPGDRVASVLPNSVAAVELYLASAYVGAIWVGINPAAPEAERARQLDLVTPAVVVTTHDMASVPAETVDAARPHLSTPSAIGFSSGTTGTPKALVHTRSGVSLAAAALSAAQLCSDDRVGIILPISIHNLMVVGAMATLFAGATCVITDQMNATGVAASCWDRQLTRVNALVPATIYDLVHDDAVVTADLATLRHAGTGAAGLSEDLRVAFETKFGKRLVGTYGMTEAPGVVALEDAAAPRRQGSSGTPLRHLAVTVRDEHDTPLPAGQEGELMVGPAPDSSYRPALGVWTEHGLVRRDESESTFRTGDYGWIDHDGTVHVSGRKADVILRGGVNVNAAELENVLGELAAVRDIAVVGERDDRLGQRIVAFVEPTAGATVDAAWLRQQARGMLAHGKVPDEFIVGVLPRNAMGKVVRAELGRLLASSEE